MRQRRPPLLVPTRYTNDIKPASARQALLGASDLSLLFADGNGGYVTDTRLEDEENLSAMAD